MITGRFLIAQVIRDNQWLSIPLKLASCSDILAGQMHLNGQGKDPCLCSLCNCSTFSFLYHYRSGYSLDRCGTVCSQFTELTLLPFWCFIGTGLVMYILTLLHLAIGHAVLGLFVSTISLVATQTHTHHTLCAHVYEIE